MMLPNVCLDLKDVQYMLTFALPPRTASCPRFASNKPRSYNCSLTRTSLHPRSQATSRPVSPPQALAHNLSLQPPILPLQHPTLQPLAHSLDRPSSLAAPSILRAATCDTGPEPPAAVRRHGFDLRPSARIVGNHSRWAEGTRARSTRPRLRC